ncbi:hypothetical protein [Janthinobacterium sp. HLX7-2]|uniref:hypothetical protein n=1 Tax=Janthinobacterium sp. HLX7-2 TaxID=1259331 RepID=UPI003F525AE7
MMLPNGWQQSTLGKIARISSGGTPDHNHGPKFYKTLDRTMPGWHGIKEKLDNMAEEILRA